MILIENVIRIDQGLIFMVKPVAVFPAKPDLQTIHS